ncbi:MAG TPA: GrpB family protein [Burkholderiaceae bacterium]|nr:GrpB family protein [Burkholderiaceae bacterium]
MIELVDYDPAWPARFADEARALGRALGERALRIEHVGSTAVPGLVAKPVVDIQVSVASLDDPAAFDDALGAAGYTHVVHEPAFDRIYPFFAKPFAWPRTHHLHLCVAGSNEEARHLAFRDHLRKHPEVACEYVRLKQQLAALHGGHDEAARQRYSLAKTDFVAAIERRALGRA